VPADPSGVNDGVHLVEYRSTDTVGNVESYHSLAVRIDTLRPRTKAASAPAVRRNRYATLKYSVNDGAASAGLAVVTIKVKTLSGRTVRTLSLGTRLTGRTYSAKVKCTWAPRTYRYYVYATDPAGNKVLRPGSNKLVVRR
jgi:hypothetical protein